MPTEGRRILVVDDDDALRARLLRAFRDRGLDARGASHPVEALTAARLHRPELALLDLRMPGGSGLDLVKTLRQTVPEVRIVVLTGYGSIATALEAVKRGAHDYLTKPADADQILAAFDARTEPAEPEGWGEVPSLGRVEWEHIQRVLADCDGNVTRAARVLGLHRRTLQRKLASIPPRR